MAEKTRANLKLLFETGDTPTQQDFYDLIDSYLNYQDDNSDDITEGSTKLFLTVPERSKIGFITVTQAVDLDSLETVANSALQPNTDIAVTKLTLADDSDEGVLVMNARSAEPTAPNTGDIYLDDGTNTASGNTGFRRYTGAAWEDIGGGSGGGGGMTSFVISDGTTTQTIVDGNTITLADGSVIGFTVSATDTVTIDDSALGSLAQQSSVSNADWSGTDLSIANGGTGSSSAAAALSALGAQEDLDGLSITSVTVAGTDKVLIQDTDDADNLKTVTAQSIADLKTVDTTEFISGFIEEASDKDYTLDLSAKYAYNIADLTIKTTSGTCTAALEINGTAVTSISSVSVSSTETTATATSANSVTTGDTVDLVISANSNAVNVAFTIEIERA